MACGDGDGEGGCFGNQSCVYDEESQTASCEAPDVCTTSLDCLDGTQCGGDACISTVTCADDTFEPNNTEAEATVFTDAATKQLVDASFCSGDTDIYTFNVGDLDPTAVRGTLSIELRYATRDIGLGELQVELLEEQGDGSFTSVATDTAGVQGQTGAVELTHEVGPATVGGFRIEVTGVGDVSEAGISYDLGVDLIDDMVSSACADARLLENGDILTADLRQATSSLMEASCTRGDGSSTRAEQVFVFDMQEPGRASITVTPESDTDDPVVSIREDCDTVGTELTCSDASAETESIDQQLLDPGTYYVVVSASGDGSLNRYEIALSIQATTCSDSSNYCEDANRAQICFGGTGLNGVDCTNGCNPTTGRCFPIDGDVCDTTTAITSNTTETVLWGELTNSYEAGGSGCVPTAEGSTQTSGPDKAFKVTIPDQTTFQASLDVGDSDEVSLSLVEDCSDPTGTCLQGVNENATGDEMLAWPNDTGGELTAFLIVDSSDKALIGQSELDISFVNFVCDPAGTTAMVCDPADPTQILECSDNRIEYTQGATCGSTYGCASGFCAADVCDAPVDLTADASQQGGTTVTLEHDSFTDTFSGDACGVTSDGSSGGDAIFELTLQADEAVRGTVEVGGSYWASVYLMPTCTTFDSSCLAGGYDLSDTATLEYFNDTGSAQTVFLVADNDDFGTGGSFDVTVEIDTPVCGNGVQEIGETCDDGNTTAGDGCSDTCQFEPDVCGNGVLEETSNNEECDDGNTNAGDGCDPNCNSVCGDGFVVGTEECDDSNTTAGDGCSDTCTIEADVCGNTVVEPSNTETCDDGNATSGDGCSAVCALEGTPIPIPATGQAVGVAGSLESSDPTFARTNTGCSLSSSANAVYYDTYEFTNNSGGDITIDLTASWAFDGYLNVNSSSFDPTQADASCLAADDDFNGTSGSQITDLTVADGDTIVVVATSFSNGATGDYTIQIDPDFP
jgi:cysteine-rich repeat protein